MVPLYKVKDDKYECTSLLIVVGKVYGNMLIWNIREDTEGMIHDKQCGFRRGNGYIC